MTRSCERCERRFPAKQPSAKYCSSSCRARASEERRSGVRAPLVEAEDVDGPLTRSTRAELAEVDRVESARGQAAIIAAQVIDSKQNAGSALSALLREWRVTLDAATVGARVLASQRDRAVDELEARRERRGA